MEKLLINDTADYFIKVIQPKLNRLKVENPFNNYEYQTLNYYNKNVWDIMDIPVKTDESKRTAKARAFSLAKQKVFFNKDLKYFVTLTYAENMQDYNKLKQDIKIFLNSEKRRGISFKYIWVVERQKRGALHIHMITNTRFSTFINDNGFYQLEMWRHGISSVLDIKGTNANFKPYLYLFKYIKKTEKIGGRYVHSSRNLNNFMVLTEFNFNEKLKQELLYEKSYMGSVDRVIKKRYYKNTE